MAKQGLVVGEAAGRKGNRPRRADYYSIVIGGVAGLTERTAEARQTVYERARQVVLRQLQATRPRLPKPVIEAEKAALEQAIEKVEAEAKAGVIHTPRVRPPKAASAPAASPRKYGQLLRVAAPFGLAMFVALVAASYWLAGGRIGGVAPARPRPAAVQAQQPAPVPALTEVAVGPQPAPPQPTSAEPRGCGPMLAATDLAACANADAERMEAEGQSAAPLWLSSVELNDPRKLAPAAPETPPPASVAPAPSPAGSKARDLTESGKQWAKKGDLERAARDLTEATRADPLYAEAWVQRGQVMFKLGDTERAIADLNEGVRLDPHNAVALRARGMAQLYKGDEESALADLSKAIQLAEADPARMPPIDLFYAHRSRAALCEKKKLYDREVYDLTAMIDSYWKDPLLADTLRTSYREAGAASLIGSIYRLRANVQVRKGTPELAIADLSFAIQLDQQRALSLLLERGRLQETLGRREQAQVDFQRVLELNPANEEAKTALARLKGQAS
jgi:tetratricopeptide (TPR) repeat protein